LLNNTLFNVEKELLAESTTMLVKLEQPWNTLMPIVVTLLGIVILARFVQFKNAELLIVVTLFGIVILVKLEQP